MSDMGALYKMVIYLLVIICGGCAVTEVIIGQGTVWGMACILAGLAIIIYIVKIPVEQDKL
jgi:hypothetical protein